ncbi:DNA gyrase subunit A [Candidatus Saccharibacteria bacterium]|nr:DNA gyrase subunit A [Candidatus Saccharibacteria bacterium]
MPKPEESDITPISEEADVLDVVYDKDGNSAAVKTEFGLIAAKTVESEMEQSYLDYAMSVIVSRALPDVRDGLKPVHRRILYAMNNLGLRHNVKYRKSATIVGEVIGKYHPHGDSAIYESMVRMAQNWVMRYMLVDGQGNFGSMDGDSAAAHRYTEARMTKFAEEILVDIDKDTVDFMPNFDGSQKEPKVLPAKLPNLLLNGVQGIAVGMATNIPTHNLTEVIDGVILLIDEPESGVAELTKIIKGPDFPTGGVIFDDGSIAHAYGTGRGSITMRAVAEIEEDKKGRERILVSQVPYQVNPAMLLTKIAELHHTKKIVGIADLRDESAKEEVRIVIELKKDAYSSKILNQLYKMTAMQTAFHVNMLALVEGIQPRVLNIEMVLRYYLDHRKVVVRRRTEFELRKAEARAHILEGLRIALDQIDKVISTIRSSNTQDEARANLISNFKLTEIQANAILAMQLRTLAGLERKKIEDEYEQLQKLIAELKIIISSEANILKVIRAELEEIKEKYGDKRKTQIIKKSIGSFSDEDLIPDEEVVVTLTKGNYVKRIASNTYASQGRGGKGKIGMATKEEDVVEHVLQCRTHDTVLFFTSLGRVFKLKVYEIPAASRTAKGQSIVNIINLGPEERVTSMLSLQKNEPTQFLFMTTKNGVIKKTKIEDFANIRTNGIICIKLDSGDQLNWVKKTADGDNVIISTAKAQAIRFKESDARPMGRATRGVRGIRLRPNDTVVGMDVIGEEEGLLLVVMENGYGKITKTAQFTSHNRGGVGIKAGVATVKTGQAIDVRIVPSTDDDVLLISKKGQVIRLRLSGISVIGRATQGVRIMRMSAGDQIASVALLQAEKIAEELEDETGEPQKEVDSAQKATTEDKNTKKK